MIVEDIIREIDQGKRVLVLTERKDHVNVLNLYLKDKFETLNITGEDPESTRRSKLEQIKLGHSQVLIATGQFIGGGSVQIQYAYLTIYIPLQPAMKFYTKYYFAKFV